MVFKKTPEVTAKDEPSSRTSGHHLAFDDVQRLFDFLKIREIIICEGLGDAFREAAQMKYARNYKTFVISHDLIDEHNPYHPVQELDMNGPKRWLRKLKETFLPEPAPENETTKQLREILRRVGPFIENLTFKMDRFGGVECELISGLVQKYCTNISHLRYIGPTECDKNNLARMRTPNMRSVESLEFRHIFGHCDATLSPYFQNGTKLKTILFERMDFMGTFLKFPKKLKSFKIIECTTLRGDNVSKCLANNQKNRIYFYMDNRVSKNKHYDAGNNVIAVLPRIGSLSYSGRGFYDVFSKMQTIRDLTALKIECDSATGMNGFFSNLPVENVIQQFSANINYELCDSAISGFGNFRHLDALKIRMEQGAHPHQLNDICRHMRDIKITTFQLIDTSDNDTDLSELGLMRNIQKLRITLNRNAINLSAIANLLNLTNLYLHISMSERPGHPHTNHSDVNDVLQTLSQNNQLQSLKLHLSVAIQLTETTIAALAQMTSLKSFTYRGSLREDSFFYRLGLLQNITSLTYVMPPGAPRADPLKLKEVLLGAEKLILFTIVPQQPNDVDSAFIVLLQLRNGLQVRVKDKTIFCKEVFE